MNIFAENFTKKMIMKRFKKMIVIALLIISSSCAKEDETEISTPSVSIETTTANVELTFTSIKISGNILSDGGGEIISHGICWSKMPNPTINDDKTVEALDSFTNVIDNLAVNSEYHFRAYATNEKGTNYSNDISFKTLTLDNTSWNFWFDWDTSGWQADIILKDDGTMKYSEPDFPGQFLNDGTWLLTENVLTIVLENSNIVFSQLTGTISESAMSGTYTAGSERTWNAVKY